MIGLMSMRTKVIESSIFGKLYHRLVSKKRGFAASNRRLVSEKPSVESEKRAREGTAEVIKAISPAVQKGDVSGLAGGAGLFPDVENQALYLVDAAPMGTR